MGQRIVNEALARLAVAVPLSLPIPPTAAMAGWPTNQVNDLDTLGGDHSVASLINEFAGVAGSAR
jgi:hypothetical protein